MDCGYTKLTIRIRVPGGGVTEESILKSKLGTQTNETVLLNEMTSGT